jgi:hypothetical protein
MGFAEGMCTVVGQIDDVLHDTRPLDGNNPYPPRL